MAWYFWPQSMWDLSTPPGIEPTLPALGGEVLTRLPGNSPWFFICTMRKRTVPAS